MSPRSDQDLVDEAPTPVLAGLERAHDRVSGGGEVRAGVPARRGIAAADVPATQTLPQMHPLAALCQTVRAAVEAVRLDVPDGIQVRASHHAYSSAGWARGWPAGAGRDSSSRSAIPRRSGQRSCAVTP